MGKVKDGSPAAKTPKVSKGGPVAAPKRQFAPFLANMLQVSLYKPLQGRQARLYTALALGFTILMGLRELHLTLGAQSSVATSYAVPTAVGLLLAWVTFRLLQYPPFVEFLIATEAEMNKVSWTTREDLKRATAVVLVTVALMAVFLFGVDWLWSNLLQAIGVLRFHNTSDLGSTA
jgi:preprotein translocase subunit SecE